MNRFFINKEQINEDIIHIKGADVKHIRDVLRLKQGEQIEVSCDCNTYIGEILEIDKKTIKLKIIDKYKGENEPSYFIVLYQGLAKGSKMDVIFQKCTEIGVSEFYPIETKRAVVKIKNEKKANSKVERWQEITDQAAKQSKRDKIPRINEVLSFEEMIKHLNNEENIIVPYEDEKQETIKNSLQNINSKKIHLIIGPEGGFEGEEIEKLKNIGANIVTLGPRTLRTETAGLVASTMVLYELGDLGVV
jgi:16S rRNA (uracil1498-N3)-methyltransferase